jgi:hypothetical protein
MCKAAIGIRVHDRTFPRECLANWEKSGENTNAMQKFHSFLGHA